MREYGFELRLCAYLEHRENAIVARQIGGGVRERARRIFDIVLVEPGDEFDRRAAITDQTIPPAAIESEVGPGRAVRWPHETDYSPAHAQRILERAEDVGFFERMHREGSVAVRQTTRYPDWIDSLTAIENKPDLSRPGHLLEQLRFDVSIGLVDRVILATESYVTGAHLNRIPQEVGVWRVHTENHATEIEEVRPPMPLGVETWGIEIGETTSGASEITAISPEEKRRARVRVAERAYGSGWRPSFPACAEVDSANIEASRALPYCEWKGRIIDPAKCGPTCQGFDSADPPPVDRAQERDRSTPWVQDPDGVQRHQAGLDAFDGDG